MVTRYMNTLLASIIILAVGSFAHAQDPAKPSATKESELQLISVIEAMARENVAASRLNVTHDIAQKRIRVLSAVAIGRIGLYKEHGYEIEVVYHPEIASFKAGAGSYRFQHNNQIL